MRPRGEEGTKWVVVGELCLEEQVRPPLEVHARATVDGCGASLECGRWEKGQGVSIFLKGRVGWQWLRVGRWSLGWEHLGERLS